MFNSLIHFQDLFYFGRGELDPELILIRLALMQEYTAHTAIHQPEPIHLPACLLKVRRNPCELCNNDLSSWSNWEPEDYGAAMLPYYHHQHDPKFEIFFLKIIIS